MAQMNEVILLHYPESIYSHRVLWYLQLRGIKYSECIQPPYLPRPDLEELGIAYRRIPILAVGENVYCDSRLIIRALEEGLPHPDNSLSARNPEDHGIQKLLENYSIDGGVFWRAASLLPVRRVPFLRDPKFIADRSEAIGRKWDLDAMEKARPEALAQMRTVFDLMETTFLADGRAFILGGTEGPTIADIDAVFPLQWLIRDPMMEDAIPEDVFSAKLYPKTFAWISRFHASVAAAKAEAPRPTTLTGGEAIQHILSARAASDQEHIDPLDPSGLKHGDRVAVNPIDHGSAHIDHGKLVRLTSQEIAIINDKGIRLHFPRWNFRIQQDSADAPNTSEAQQKRSMRYIYHPMSPYSRKCYMLALELGIASRLQLEEVVVAPIPYKGWSDNNDEVGKFNPMAKIPTLVPGEHGDGIYDSRTICEYLEEQGEVVGAKAVADTDHVKRWRLKTLHACADGLLDAQVLIIYENKIRAENGVRFQTWVDGQNEKIGRCLDRLEVEAQRGTLVPRAAEEAATAAEVAVAATLGFMDINKHEWRNGRSRLKEWFVAWEHRASFTSTRPELDWKTGETKALGFAKEAIDGAK